MALFEAIRITNADFNGDTWDGSPFESLPEWLVMAVADGYIYVKPTTVDYAVWRIDRPEYGPVGDPLCIGYPDDYVVRFPSGYISIMPKLAVEALMPISVSSEDSNPDLRLYACFLETVKMSPGKMAAQAGHAYLHAFVKAQEEDSERTKAYLRYPATKIALRVPDETALRNLEDLCKKHQIPHSVVVDSGKTEFDGPTLTCIGIGPITKQEGIDLLGLDTFKRY